MVIFCSRKKAFMTFVGLARQLLHVDTMVYGINLYETATGSVSIMPTFVSL